MSLERLPTSCAARPGFAPGAGDTVCGNAASVRRCRSPSASRDASAFALASWVVLEDLRPAADAAFAADGRNRRARGDPRRARPPRDRAASRRRRPRRPEGHARPAVAPGGRARTAPDRPRRRALPEAALRVAPAARSRRAERVATGRLPGGGAAARLPSLRGRPALRDGLAPRTANRSCARASRRRHRWTGAGCSSLRRANSRGRRVSRSPPPAIGSSSTSRESCHRARS